MGNYFIEINSYSLYAYLFNNWFCIKLIHKTVNLFSNFNLEFSKVNF